MKTPTSLQDALRSAAETDRGLQFFDRSGKLSIYPYAQLLIDAGKYAASLRARGIEPGDTVGVIFSTSYAMVQTLFGILMAGAIPFCLAPPRLGRGSDYSATTARMITRARAKLVVTDDSILNSLQKVSSIVPNQFIGVSELNGNETYFYEASSNSPAVIQFSSGTTVDPKPILLSHGNLIANTNAILTRFPGDLKDHSGLSWLPMHHDMGLIGGLFTAIVGKGNGTFLRPEDFVLRPGLWLRALTETRATISPCPNFALKLCTERVTDDELDSLDLSSWQIALVGAETVHLRTLRDFYDRFKRASFNYATFTPVYGLAEATLAVSFSDPALAPQAVLFDADKLGQGQAEEKPNGTEIVTVGTALPGFTIEIRNSKGEPLPENCVGDIFIRGDSIMAGYFDDAQAPEWLNTGDLGFFFKGNLYLYGRSKDLIIINGRNHDPSYIEFATEGVPGLRHERTAAFASETEKQSEGVVLIVERDKSDQQTPEILAQLVRDAVAEKTGLIAESVHILESGEIPRTTSGKVKRAEARRKYIAGDFKPIASC
ncbi:MAG: AMP-binding protein [Spirochaetia bacterium]|nr:AMP-binding protein [Spirochaetia bacterium]